MATTTLSAFVDATPEAVFGTLVDPHRLPEWNRTISRVLDAPERMAPGAEWVVEVHALAQHWPSRSRVIELDASARRFAHRSCTDDGNPSYALWSWQVAEEEQGSRVTVSWALEPRSFWRKLLFARVRGHQLGAEVRASLTALGTAASGPAPHPPSRTERSQP